MDVSGDGLVQGEHLGQGLDELEGWVRQAQVRAGEDGERRVGVVAADLER